nr:MAG TPA: hypothetical protein [Caudoviricetes sp.]
MTPRCCANRPRIYFSIYVPCKIPLFPFFSHPFISD